MHTPREVAGWSAWGCRLERVEVGRRGDGAAGGVMGLPAGWRTVLFETPLKENGLCDALGLAAPPSRSGGAAPPLPARRSAASLRAPRSCAGGGRPG